MFRLEVVIILQRCSSDVVFSKALQSSAKGSRKVVFLLVKKVKRIIASK